MEQSAFARAKARTRERFGEYARALLMFGLAFIGLVAVTSVIVAALIWIRMITPGGPIGMILMLLTFGIIFAVALFAVYAGILVSLVLVQIVALPMKQGFHEILKSSRPLARSYLDFNVKVFLFYLILVPFDIVLTSIIKIPILFCLWIFWSCFSVYVFLEKRKKGLANLWTSRAILNSNLWYFASRFLLLILARAVLYIAAVILMAIPMAIGIIFAKNIAVVVIMVILTFLLFLAYIALAFILSVFDISYTYELYSKAQEPAKIRTPKEWYFLAVAGIVVGIVLFALFPEQSMKAISNYTDRGDSKRKETIIVSLDSSAELEFKKKSDAVIAEAKRGLNLGPVLYNHTDGASCSSYKNCHRYSRELYAVQGSLPAVTKVVYDGLLASGWKEAPDGSRELTDHLSTLLWDPKMASESVTLEGQGINFIYKNPILTAHVGLLTPDAQKILGLGTTNVFYLCDGTDICKIMEQNKAGYEYFILVDYKTQEPAVVPTGAAKRLIPTYAPPTPTPSPYDTSGSRTIHESTSSATSEPLD